MLKYHQKIILLLKTQSQDMPSSGQNDIGAVLYIQDRTLSSIPGAPLFKHQQYSIPDMTIKHVYTYC